MRDILMTVAAALLLAATPGLAETPASNPHDVPEPQGLYQGVPHGYTPTTLAGATIWMPQHRTIPGSDWLPGAGSGTDDQAFTDAFRTRAATLTGGKPATPIVVFCHPDCWASYNAAKRLVGLGYTHVNWYRDGLEGWQDGHDTAVVRADPAWLASLPKTLTQ